MFSSTELIRKSKMVFDKISKKDIDKAVILRDGKPSFMLMDFKKYEELINDYLDLKEKVKTKPKVIKKEIKQKEDKPLPFQEKEEEIFDEIDSNDLENALAQIEQLDLELKKDAPKHKEEQLKDFWE